MLPWDDASPGITDVSALLDKPAGARGFVAARQGHLFEGEKRLRIFGVNFAFGANFPTHADAEKIAARMAKFGINCVRFHHMDNLAAPNGIWSADMKTLDPGQLDKLDYFIAQLKKNGIYADLNLHVSRDYPGMPKWPEMYDFFKGVDIFYPPMIAMQRDYARQLLTHVNAYTHAAYTDEPAVAIVEINNENGLISRWWGGAFDSMPGVYRDELAAQWNRWLQTRYPSQAALEKAWNAAQEPWGPEMLKESNFDEGAGGAWNLEQLGDAKAEAVRKEGALCVSVSHADGIPWHVQLSQHGIAFSKGRHYTLAFRARADKPRIIALIASQTHEPWGQLWSTNVEVSGDWKEYHIAFEPSADEPQGRILFSGLGEAGSTCCLADVSLRTGGVLGLQKNERLGAMPIFGKSEIGMRDLVAQHDWMRFLYDAETQYWTGMEQFLKKDLGAKSLIVGTATGDSPPVIQAKLDVVDGHAYWHHPKFPGRPWDPANWTVENEPMAGHPDGGTLPGLSSHRVAGKPYICTEYNEASPNPHSSEAFLLLNAYAALQDWDGVFAFAYSHSHDDWDTRSIGSFFNIDQNPTKMATLPAAVSMFLRGDVAAAKNVVTYPVSWEAAIDASLHSGAWWSTESFGMPRMLPMQSRVQIGLGAGTPASPAFGNGKFTASDTGELTWDAEKGRVLLNAPRSKAFIGKVTGEEVRLGDVAIEPQANMQNFAAITVTDMSTREHPRDILITATGYSENTGMGWTSPQKDSVGNNWGTAPSLVEGIPAKITLPAGSAGAKAWALDARGQRMTPVDVSQTDRGTAIEIGPRYKTLWYEVEIPASR